MEREACVCDHGYERSDLCAEIIIIIIIIITLLSIYIYVLQCVLLCLVALHGDSYNKQRTV